MRLLHSSTLQLEEFSDDRIPTYVILSHTWGDGEVSFQDMQGRAAKEKKGYSKIQGCCSKAADDGFEYVWIDTCCIDKSSSAELTEAINSMYQWYQNAERCYAYLADVDLSEEPRSGNCAFANSRWFTRGWTLQELIAPLNLVFFSVDWQEIGEKSNMKSLVSEVTGISTEILTGADLRTTSIAQRMSWASKRRTTRLEDISYCLMGIFGVNMPLLYGEGEKSFVRLQEEIMRDSNDHSLFAWRTLENSARGLLARSPSEFAGSKHMIPLPSWDVSTPYSMTNCGLCIELQLIPFEEEDVYLAVLECKNANVRLSQPGIWVKRISPGGDQFYRKNSSWIKDIDQSLLRTSKKETIYIRKDFSTLGPSETIRKNWIFIDTLPARIHSYALVQFYPLSRWDIRTRSFSCDHQASYEKLEAIGAISFEDDNQDGFVVVLGIVNENTAIVRIIPKLRDKNIADIYKDVQSGLYGEYKKVNRAVIDLAKCLGGITEKKCCVHTSRGRAFGQSMFVVDIGLGAGPCRLKHRQEDIIV